MVKIGNFVFHPGIPVIRAAHIIARYGQRMKWPPHERKLALVKIKHGAKVEKHHG